MRGRGFLFLVAGLYALGILAPAAILTGILIASLERERAASFEKRRLEIENAADAVIEAVAGAITRARAGAPEDPGGGLDDLLRRLWGPAAPERGLVRLVDAGTRGGVWIHPFESAVDFDPVLEDALLFTSAEYRGALLAEQRGDPVEAAGRLRLALAQTRDAREAVAVRLALARVLLAGRQPDAAQQALAGIDQADHALSPRLRLRVLDAARDAARAANPHDRLPALRRAVENLLDRETHRLGYFVWAAAVDAWAGDGSRDEDLRRLPRLRALYRFLAADRARLAALHRGASVAWSGGETGPRVIAAAAAADAGTAGVPLTFVPPDDLLARARAQGLDPYLARRDFALTSPAAAGADAVRVETLDRTLGLIDRAPVGASAWADADARLLLILAALTLLGLLAGFGFTLLAVNKQARLARLRADFISSVSHELKTPLTSLLLFTDLLRSGRVTDPDKVRECHDFMGEESARLAHLVDNILDFARLEDGRKNYRFTPVDAGEAVRRTAAAFAARAEAAGTRIDASGVSLEPLRVTADRDAIERVVANLLDNAIKYGVAGHGAIELGARRTDGRVVITVADHGPGIPPGARRRVFARFTRGEHHGPDAPAGSGLGLAIVADLVAAHGGDVAVSATAGGGTTVTVALPWNPGEKGKEEGTHDV